MRTIVTTLAALLPFLSAAKTVCLQPGDTLPQGTVALEVTAKTRSDSWTFGWPGASFTVTLDPFSASDGLIQGNSSVTCNGIKADAPALDSTGRPNTVSIEWHGTKAVVTAGSRCADYVMAIDSLPRPVGVLTFTGRAKPLDIIAETAEQKRQSVMPVTARTQRWHYIDRDWHNDSSMVRMGGTYTLGLEEQNDTIHLLYIDGARTNPALWTEGTVKATLIATGFENHYRMHWTMADGAIAPGENYAVIDPGQGLMELHFPLLKAVLRFGKE